MHYYWVHIYKVRFSVLSLLLFRFPKMESHRPPHGYMPIILSPTRDYLSEYEALLAARDYHGVSGDFRVVAYNVLADYCLSETPHLYEHCPPQCLDLMRRCQFISAELRYLKPTVLCLQEVDQGFTHYFKTVRNAQWLYKKRSDPSKRDGVAIVFDSEVFDLVETAEVEYKSSEIRRLDRPNVGLIAVLRSKATPNQGIIVGNTHLLFNFRRGDIQLSQLLLFLSAVQNTQLRYESQLTLSIILAGDYNFTPSSPLYKFITERELDMSAVPPPHLADRNAGDTRMVGCGQALQDRVLRRYRYQAKLRYQGDIQLGKELSCLTVELVSGEGGKLIYQPTIREGTQDHILRLSLPLQSAYVSVTGREGFPFGYIDRVVFTTDYLWHCGELQATGALLPPHYASLFEAPSLPTAHYPSDHISLAVDFAWRRTESSLG